MAFRFHRLKTRTGFAIACVVVGSLVLNAVYTVLSQRAELRREIEERASTFAELTHGPICVAYDELYRSGFYKFRELVRENLSLNPDVEYFLIVDVNGQVVFDSRELNEARLPQDVPPGPSWIREPERLEAVKRLEPTTLKGRSPTGEERLEIIAPYLEDWGRHRLSISYLVSYRSLRPKVLGMVAVTGGLTLVSMLLAVAVAMTLARHITRPLEELMAGARHIAEGHFDRRLDVRSGDELQVLAETFNHMTERLKGNVDQLGESNRKLATLNEELQELDRVKSDLLANVSHELRTPLTAIKGYTDYILEGKLGPVTEKQEKGLVVVQRNLDRLSRTIGALLDFSRMDLGRITLNLQPFSLANLLEQIATTIRSELDKKRLTFVVDMEPTLPPVIADRERLSAVIENLVINAIKFTSEGGQITVAAARLREADRPSAEIRVSDTGIGIPRDQLGKIFNRFHQVDGSTTRRFGGVGLGLAIVKSILDAHGTSIQVESEEGRGTAFVFQLPLLEKADSAAREARPREKVEEGLVLVVDDDPEIQRLVRAYLEEEGLAVVSATTAAAARTLALERHPDVILLDLFLPDGNGLDLLPALKADPATHSIPVLVISIMRDAVKALSLGAAEHMAKPLQRDRLVAAVRGFLSGIEAEEPTVLVVDDEPDTAELVRDTLRHEGLHTVVAYDGRQALEVVERKRPDLVILDIMMPELSGFEVLEALGRRTDTAGIPVLILSGRGDDEDVRRALSLGARRYMSKPFAVRELIAEVRRHLGRVRAEGARRASV
jgi:signal transduction histidine kinase/DNA-binding response OmpR family regulator